MSDILEPKLTSDLLVNLKGIMEIVERSITHPYGAPVTPELKQMAGKACVFLTDGDADKARTLWKLILTDSGGYMPASVAAALVRAANTANLVPDVEAPVPT